MRISAAGMIHPMIGKAMNYPNKSININKSPNIMTGIKIEEAIGYPRSII